MPHTIGSPNPQNGSNNPYNPNTYSYSSNSTISAGQIYAAGTGILSGSAIGLSKADLDSVTIQPVSRSVMEMNWVGDSISYVFTGEENNTTVKMVLTPEADLKPIEMLLLTTMIQACANRIATCEGVMRYVRANNLERHFKFSVT